LCACVLEEHQHEDVITHKFLLAVGTQYGNEVVTTATGGRH